jgi:hypothetical protein
MPTFWKLIAFAVILLNLPGCDSRKIDELEEGVSTEAAVRAQFGEPSAVYDEAGGSRTLEYPRQPQGQRNYMITIGPDGKMSALRQVLKADTFRRIAVGMDPNQVRRLLGPPARRIPFELKREEVWEWRFRDDQESKLFLVTFNAKDEVVSTAQVRDEPN